MQHAILKPLKKGKEINLNFETFDVETESGTWDKFFFLGHYDGKTYRSFEHVDMFVNWLFERPEKELSIYAHYLDFDIMFIYEYVRKRKQILSKVNMTNSLTLSVTLYKDNKKRIFYNSFSVLPYSLDKLMRTFLKKGKTPLDDLAKRNREDCVDLHSILQTFFGNVRQGGLTISQIAMNYFRTGYLSHEVHNNFRFDNLVRETYHGGRVEIFNFNIDPEKTAYLFDINSMYPYVMKENPYPIGKYEKTYKHDPDSLGICKVVAKDMSNIPFMCETISHETMFLAGKKEMWITTALYESMKEQGQEIEFKYGYETNKVEYIFEDFIKDLFSRRLKAKEQNDEVWNFTYKLLMNSLYGKFGQRTEKKTYYINVESDSAEGLIPITPDAQFSYLCEKHRNIFVVPSIASFVTEYAKLHLRDYMGRLPFEDLIYCDTDSVYAWSDRLENSKQLGKMKLEARAKPFFVVKPKLYLAGDESTGKFKIKAKGIPQSEINLINFHKFLSGEQIVSKRGLVKFKSAIKKMHRTGKFVMRNEIKRGMRSVYTKRKIDGLETEPFNVRRDGHYYAKQNEHNYRAIMESLIPIVGNYVEE